MVAIIVAATWAILVTRVATTQNEEYNQTTWGSVVISCHGERTPLVSRTPKLTAVGAEQALQAGSIIRTRFISGPNTKITQSFPINGISANIIDNTQLYLLATDSDYIAASAQAFMRGVYPPFEYEGNVAKSGPANGAIVGSQMDGYQYPTIETISPLDYNYMW
jgi:hypothetical protein